MSNILGYEFYQGPEVPPPRPIDHTGRKTAKLRVDWAQELRDMIRRHDAWGIFVVKPNTDVVLYDVRSVYQATEHAYTAYLLLAKETKT